MGILIYPVGFVMLFPVSLQNYFLNSFPTAELRELTGIFLQVAGAILIAVGIIRAVSKMVSSKLQEERAILLVGITSKLNDKISTEMSRLNATLNQTMNQKVSQPQSCKYCGAEIPTGANFCKACGKAQK